MEKLVLLDTKELNLPFEIFVSRNRITGANPFGRPNVKELDSRSFKNFREALNWAANSPEYSHYFEIPLPMLKISAKLERDKSIYSLDPQRQFLTVSSAEKSGLSPRMIDHHHSVSADPESLDIHTINIDLENNQRTLFDRGVAWIHPNQDQTTLSFGINAGVHTEEELEAGIIQMAEKVDQVITDLINGMQDSSQGTGRMKDWIAKTKAQRENSPRN